MKYTCKTCSQPFELTTEDLSWYKKFQAEPQGLCFECDQKQRLCYRNERVLYNRTCYGTGRQIISIYAPDSPYKVYCSEYWYGDQWDPLKYGQDMDFSRPFFEQLQEIDLKVPHLALINIKSENSEYCNCAYNNKNCYLMMGSDFNEDCLYGTLSMHNHDSLDLDYSNANELSYMLNDAINCYGSQFIFDSKNCNNCAFISDCIGCNDCILCTNLVNKSFCINNVQLTKKEYLEKKKELMNGSYAQQQKNFNDFLKLREKRIVKYAHTISCENCSGDYIKNSKNCQNCYDVSDSEDLRNIVFANNTKDAFNSSLLGDKSELCYNTISTANAHNTRHSFFSIDCFDVQYSKDIISCQNIFGCSSLYKKNYCILNKQYSKEYFEKLRTKIIEHMKKTGEYGQFLPKKLSCFGYNESTAHKYYPLTKEQALAQDFNWRDEDNKSYQPQTYQLPETIAEAPESITKEVLACEKCQRNFKILPQELKFYQKLNIPIPRICSECRHRLRTELRSPKKLWQRQCKKCPLVLQTTYAPNRPETVYCEDCYLKEIH